MDINILTYCVQKGDTIQSVAEKLGIPAETLKHYHNTYCDLKDLIGHDLTGVYEIMVPSPETINELKKSQNHKEVSEILSPFYLTKDFYVSEYKVSESFAQSGREDLNITYLLSVKLRETTDRGFIAEIETTDFSKAGEFPEDKMSQLSLFCMKNISPIAFLIPAQGKIKRFYDHKAIVKKFEDKRSDLNDFFIGESSNDYLNTFYSNLKNENDLLRQFCSNPFYQILFPEMNWFHRKKDWKEYYDVVPDSFPVKCHFHTEYDFENFNHIEVIIKGKIVDDCSLQELLKGVRIDEFPGEKVSGEIELKYTFHKEHKQLGKIEAYIILLHEEKIYQKYRLLLTAK
ncbi:hypothetical protein [Chryseobacterium lineare]